MSVPPGLVGAWRRSGLLVDGVRQVDYCDVIWLQTPEWYADIRLRIDPAATPPTEGVAAMFAAEIAFAGTGNWSQPIMTWNHALDSSLEPAVDANPITWEDGVAVERGRVRFEGRDVPFVEEWLRTTGDDVTWSATHADRRVRVEVGRWAIEITDDRPGGRFVATRSERDGDGWIEHGSVEA
jgi:hypothetical protein